VEARFYWLSQNEPHQEVRWKGSILSMAWSPNARYLAAGTQEATVNFWKLPYRVGEELNMTGYANKIKELALGSNEPFPCDRRQRGGHRLGRVGQRASRHAA
jgi:hypothetical protein